MFTDALIAAVRSLVNAYGADATRRALEADRALLMSPEARELLEHQLTAHKATSREHRVIAARLAAIERSRQGGIDPAFAGYDAACKAIIALLDAADWKATRAALSENLHDLLPEVTDVAFADLLMQPSTDDEYAHVAGGWALVRSCREVGVDAAVDAQQRGRRGFIIDTATAAAIVGAGSAEELARVKAEDPDLARMLGRRAEVRRQLAAWPGGDAYLRAVGQLDPADAVGRIELAEAALAEIDRDALPLLWAMIALDLAAAQWDISKGAESPDVRQAIRLWRAVLEILDPKAEPDQYGRTQRRLGTAYLADTAGGWAENTECAIEAFEAALSVYRRTVEPVEWAQAATNLAEALRRRGTADRTADLDRAVQLAGDAIETLEGRERPELLAIARVNLGAMLSERATGTAEENRSRAQAHFERALADWQPRFGAETAVVAQLGLGSLAWTLSRSEHWRYRELLDEADKRFRAALEAAKGPGLSRFRAFAHQGIGLVSSDRVRAGAAEYDTAVEHLGEAVRLLEAAGAAPVQVAGLCRNLGVVCGERPDGDRTAHRMAAAAHFARALSLLDADAHPSDRRDTLRAFGALHFRARRWQEAHDCYEEAAEIARRLLGGLISAPGRSAEVTQDRSLFSEDAYCLIRLGRPAEALVRLDQGMARMLTESLSLQAAAVSADPADERSVSWGLAEIRRLENEARSPAAQRNPERAAHLGQRLRDAYRHLGDAIGGAWNRSLELADLVAEIPARGAVVVPMVTSQGGAAIVAPAGTTTLTSDNVVDLPELDLAALGAIVFGEGGAGGWLNAYLGSVNEVVDDGQLMDALTALLSQLDASLLGPVRKKLTELGVAAGQPVVFLPQGWLSVLPLHAAAREGAEQSFLDHYEVRIAPSLATLRVCNSRLEEAARAGSSLLAVANPTLDLDSAEAEVASLAEAFGDQPQEERRVLIGESATREAVLAGLGGRHYAHFACHGRFDLADPRASVLELAGDDRLSLDDLLSPASNFDAARLVVLSACETGLTDVRTMPDEFIGMAGALLEAGAAGVVCSLWPVDDLATKLLMAEFYRRHLGGAGVAAALRGAQLWLRRATADQLELARECRRVYERSGDAAARADAEHYEEHPDEVPFSDPYFWAGFTATGASCLPAIPTAASSTRRSA